MYQRIALRPMKFTSLRYSYFLIALGGLMFVLAVPAARADLRISDDAPHSAIWRKVYDLLPDVWKTRRTIVVQELSSQGMERLIADLEGEQDNSADDSEVDGCYQAGGEDMDVDATISLLDSLHGESAQLVFAHEYGHFVWDELLTSQQRQNYRHVWRAQKRAGHLVTDYSRESAVEGFAESFAHFLIKPPLLNKRDAKSAAFLHNLIDEMRAQSDSNPDPDSGS